MGAVATKANGGAARPLRVAMLLHKTVVHDSRVRREAAALAEAGHDVTVLELAPVPAGEERLDGFARASALPPAWLRERLPAPVYRSAFAASFVRAAVTQAPDVVHAHDAAMLLPGVFAARATGARLVYDSHELATSVPYRERSWAAFVAGIERVGIPRAAVTITVSDGIAERLQARYGLRTRPVVLRNVCALPAPVPGAPPAVDLRARLGLPAGTALVLHQGAPAQARGGPVLVRAMAGVPDAHLVFLGDGEPAAEAEIDAVAAGLGLADRVHRVPAVPLADLLAVTAQADVGVSLLQDTCENHRLALPNKVFEYLTAGLPVVVSDLPEIARLVREHGVGRAVAPGDPGAVAAGLRAVLAERADPALQARVAAAAHELSWTHERRRLEDAYAALARG